MNCPKCKRELLLKRDGSGLFCPRCDSTPARNPLLGRQYGRKVA